MNYDINTLLEGIEYLNKSLLEEVKKSADEHFKTPSAAKNNWILRTYIKMGGRAKINESTIKYPDSVKIVKDSLNIDLSPAAKKFLEKK
jgi:hypothetical protein